MKVRIRPAFAAYLLSMALLSSLSGTLCALAALMVHELAHLAAARAMGEHIGCLELAPFGGVMTYEPGQGPSKGPRGMLVAAAGPLANEGAILFLTALCTRVSPDSAVSGVIRSLMTANAAMLLINLMPALPLDGGRLLFCAGYYFLDVSVLSLVLSTSGVVLGLSLCGMAILGALRWGMLNLSLMIVGGYLALSAVRSRDALLTENLYAVVHERSRASVQAVPVRLYRVGSDTPLFALLPSMARSRACAFLLEIEKKEILLSERVVRTMLLENPSMPVGPAFLRTKEKKRE